MVHNGCMAWSVTVAYNWADGPFIMMLKQLHSSAMPDTRLVIVNWILLHTCVNTLAKDVPSAVPAKPTPVPLLPSYGYPNITCFQHDAMVCLPAGLST